MSLSLLAVGTRGCRLAQDKARVEDGYSLENWFEGPVGGWSRGLEDPQCLGAAHHLSPFSP